jgi:hypothetical protein
VKTLLRLCLVASSLCALGGAAVLLAERRTTAPLPLRFDPQPFVIPAGLMQDDETDIAIDVVNSSDAPARIVGVREFCSHACFYGKGLPVTIPAKGRGQVTIRLKANDIGPFSDEVEFFTDRPSQPELTLRIEGDIEEGASDATPVQAFKP